MRYLYGDSVPFPLQFNFLATLEAFMAAATRVVKLESEAYEAEKTTGDDALTRNRGLEALEGFHNIVMRAVQETAQKVQHPHALEYARQVGDHAAHIVDAAKRAAMHTSEQELATVRAENGRRRLEVRSAIDAFLKVARLPSTGSKISLRLDETTNALSAVFANADGIVTSFSLSAAKAPAWASPRKVSDFTQGLDLMVGVKKSWLKGTVTAEKVHIDDYVISAFDLSDESAEIHLRRKIADQKDALVFRARRSDAGITCDVEHPGDPNADALPAALDPSDLPHLERLWQGIRVAFRDVVDHKEQLVSVHLDGVDIFEGGQVIAFIARLITMFAPTVAEIAQRSPNPFELSLKVEQEDGRREEIYLKKDDIVQRLQPLSAAGRQVFAPLGLDSWVPSATVRPPDVAPNQ